MPTSTKTRSSKPEGSIGNSFASLAGEKQDILPERYLTLKRAIIGDADNQARIVASWARLISHLANLADEIEEQKQDVNMPLMIPEVTYEDLISSRSTDVFERIRACGSVVVRNTVDEQQATKWLSDIQNYIKENPQVKGFPENDKAVYEVYWSKSQQEARSHPRMLKTQAALLSIFTAHDKNDSASLTTPLLYSDRLRIRKPGDAKFALGPHMDGGSIERWEDPDYRTVFKEILEGHWEEFDAFRIEKRATANQDIYLGPGSTSVFRAWQGWTSLSSTGPTEGTLLVYPRIREHSAYVLLRPFFKSKLSRADCASKDEFLSSDNWVLDLTTSDFPGSVPRRGQELANETHPHLQLDRTMVCMPKVKPGDSVWWHGDVIHAVESEHRGANAAAVMYIPAVPLTVKNAQYIRDQRETFISGRPAPDFPGGVGESHFSGRGTVDDLLTTEGKQGMGLLPFDCFGTKNETDLSLRREANRIWGF